MMVWDVKEIEKLRELYYSGLSDEEISVKFGVSEHSIKYQRRVNGFVNRNKFECGVDVDQFCEFYESGLSDTKLAEKFNLSVYHIKRLRRELGYVSQMEKRKSEIQATHEKMLELYSKNYTDVAISKELGVTTGVVYRWRAANNLPIANEHYKRMVEARINNNAMIEELDNLPIANKFADPDSLYNNIDFLEELLNRKLKY